MSTKKSNNTAISDWVKAARKNKGLTQKDLAAKLKISKRSLENYEKGVVMIPIATALAVEKICDYPQDFFGIVRKGKSSKDDGRKDKKVATDTTEKYILILEKTLQRLEKENDALKTQGKKSSTKAMTSRKK